MEAPVFTGKVGVYSSKYVRMEQCGQLDVLGRFVGLLVCYLNWYWYSHVYLNVYVFMIFELDTFVKHTSR